MSERAESAVCFRCGGPTDELNELEEGVHCPACVDRLTETLPPIFHTPWTRVDAEADADLDAEDGADVEANERRADDA